MSFITGLKEFFKKPLYIILLIAFIVAWFLIVLGYTFFPFDGFRRLVFLFIGILGGFIFLLFIVSFFLPVNKLNYIIIFIIFLISLPIIIIFDGFLDRFYFFLIITNLLFTAFFAFKLCMNSSTKVDDYLYNKKKSRKITRPLEFVILGFLNLWIFIMTWRIMSSVNPVVAQNSAGIFRIVFWINFFLIIVVIIRLLITKKLAAFSSLFLILTFFYILYIIIDTIAAFMIPATSGYAWYSFIIDLFLFFYIIGSVFDKVDYLKSKLKIIRAETISLFVILMKLYAQVFKILPGFIVTPEIIFQQQIFLLWIFIIFTLLFGIYSIFAHKEGKTKK